MSSKKIVGVVGCGNGGATIGAHMKLLGHEVRLYDIVEQQLQPIIANNNMIHLKNALEADVVIDIVSYNLQDVIQGADIIIVSVPAHCHKFAAKDMAPYLEAGQFVLAFPGGTGCCLEMIKVLKENKCPVVDDITVVEAQTLLYACRREEATVYVHGIKNQVLVGGLPRKRMPKFFEMVSDMYPQFREGPHGFWSTSLNNMNMLFHPAPTLLNLGRMESGQTFQYYLEGVTRSIAEMIEALDAEKVAVAKAFGVTIPTSLEWFKASYGIEADNIYDVLQKNKKAYSGIMAPVLKTPNDKYKLRYVIEDVPTGLVPITELAIKVGVKTPAMNAIIDLANFIYHSDFRKTGRHLEQLGLTNMTVEEMRLLAE